MCDTKIYETQKSLIQMQVTSYCGNFLILYFSTLWWVQLVCVKFCNRYIDIDQQTGNYLEAI